MSLKVSTVVALAALLLMGTSHARAADTADYDDAPADSDIEVHVVSANRVRDDVHELPYALDHISAQSLTRRFSRSVPEALADTPGVLVQKTAHGQGSPYIRGFTGYRTLALIDGIRYNNGAYRDGPNEYFSLIDIESVARIEVLSGPASVLYGSDAVGGVVSVETQGSDYDHASAGAPFIHGAQKYRYSSADSSHLSRTKVDLGSGGRWGLHVGYSLKDFGDVHAADIGRQPHTGYGEHAIDARLDIAVAPQWTVTGVHQRLAQDDVWRTHATVFGRSFRGTTVGTDLRRSKDQQRSLSYLRLHGRPALAGLDEARLTFSQQSWLEQGERLRGNNRGLFERFQSNMSGVDLALVSQFPRLGLRYGADYYRDNIDSYGARFNPGGTLAGINIQGPLGDDARFGMLGMHVQADVPVTARVGLIAGTRHTRVRARIGRYADPASGTAASFRSDWNETVSSLRAIVAVREDGTQHLWTAVSQSFRAPNIADLSRFGASRSSETEIAATQLDAENFLSYELGWKGRWSSLATALTLFHTRIHDYIASTPTGRFVDGLIEVSKRNSASGYVQGIEWRGDYGFGSNWYLRANLAWQKGQLDNFASTTAASSFREPLSRIMPVTANLRLDWHSDDQRWWLSSGLTLSGEADRLSEGDRHDTERIPPGGTPGYALLSLHAGHVLTHHVSVVAGLDNVLDSAYRSHGSGSNEAGIGGTVGVTVEF